MKVIIAGGGTGGHLFPAISIAEEILARNDGSEVLFVGSEQGIEKKILPERGYKAEFVNSKGIVGKSFFEIAKAVISMLGAMGKSMKILKNFRPDAVIGVGGYASVPTLLCASAIRIPTAICEQNSVPGLANRILSRLVAKIFITFEESMDHFPTKKTVLTGNPIRRDIAESAEERSPRRSSKYNVFVLGGSQGARKLNEIVPSCLGRFDAHVTVTHQTGGDQLQKVKETYRDLGIQAEVFGFREDISLIYEKTDLVICRAGAGTLSEITAFGIPAILVPLASSTHGHQLKNARVMERNDAAVVIEERELEIQGLCAVIEKTLEPGALARMAANSKKLARADAASRIVNEIEQVIG